MVIKGRRRKRRIIITIQTINFDEYEKACCLSRPSAADDDVDDDDAISAVAADVDDSTGVDYITSLFDSNRAGAKDPQYLFWSKNKLRRIPDLYGKFQNNT